MKWRKVRNIWFRPLKLFTIFALSYILLIGKYGFEDADRDFDATGGFKSKKEGQKMPDNINMEDLMGSTFA